MRSRNFVIGVVSSVLVVAVALGLLVLLGPADGGDLELPDRVDGLVATDLPAAYPGSDPKPTVFERARAVAESNSEGYSDVFDGAAADTRVYTDSDVSLFVSVVAVRADTGPLLPPGGFIDPDLLGYALAPVERTTDGDVECLLTRSNLPRAGTDVDAEDSKPDAVVCQRRSGHLTVRVQATTDDPDRIVDIVGDVWDELD